MAAMEDGTRVSLSCLAADAYVSPDWYRTIVAVPTWNYIAVEGVGAVRRLPREELHKLLADLSAQEERKLAPKPPWTMDKVAPERIETMLNAIVGFALTFEHLEGKFKLSQDKPDEDVQGVIEGPRSARRCGELGGGERDAESAVMTPIFQPHQPSP